MGSYIEQVLYMGSWPDSPSAHRESGSETNAHAHCKNGIVVRHVNDSMVSHYISTVV